MRLLCIVQAAARVQQRSSFFFHSEYGWLANGVRANFYGVPADARQSGARMSQRQHHYVFATMHCRVGICHCRFTPAKVTLTVMSVVQCHPIWSGGSCPTS
jgi:hypothetical protein